MKYNCRESIIKLQNTSNYRVLLSLKIPNTVLITQLKTLLTALVTLSIAGIAFKLKYSKTFSFWTF